MLYGKLDHSRDAVAALAALAGVAALAFTALAVAVAPSAEARLWADALCIVAPHGELTLLGHCPECWALGFWALAAVLGFAWLAHAPAPEAAEAA